MNKQKAARAYEFTNQILNSDKLLCKRMYDDYEKTKDDLPTMKRALKLTSLLRKLGAEDHIANTKVAENFQSFSDVGDYLVKPDEEREQIIKEGIKELEQGLYKVMAEMGIKR